MPKTLFYPAQIKKLCQYLVQLAEVIPTSSGRSPYPPSALTRGRLAHFVHLRTSGFSQCSHTSVSHSVVLHGFLSFFPTLAQGCFPFFSLWVLDCRFWAELHFFSSCENDFLLVLWIHSPFFSKGHVSHQSSSHQVHSFLNAQRGVLSPCTFHTFSVSFVAWRLQSSGYVFQSLAVVSSSPSGAVWWVV